MIAGGGARRIQLTFLGSESFIVGKMRFSLKTAFVLILVGALLTVVYQKNRQLSRMKQLAEVRIEVFDDRQEFEKRLGQVVCVDFDDVDTTAKDFVSINSDHFAKQGLLLNNSGGFFVGRTFGFPLQYPAQSKPNSFSPGPVGKNPGGDLTEFTFGALKRPSLAAGFGALFIDADYPGIHASGIRVYGWDDRLIGEEMGFRGLDGRSVFRGVITVDGSGNLVSAISRVEVVSGSGWPGVDAGDGVTLDDVVFGNLSPNDLNK